MHYSAILYITNCLLQLTTVISSKRVWIFSGGRIFQHISHNQTCTLARHAPTIKDRHLSGNYLFSKGYSCRTQSKGVLISSEALLNRDSSWQCHSRVLLATQAIPPTIEDMAPHSKNRCLGCHYLQLCNFLLFLPSFFVCQLTASCAFAGPYSLVIFLQPCFILSEGATAQENKVYKLEPKTKDTPHVWKQNPTDSQMQP